MDNLLVVDNPKAYNIILGRPFITTTKETIYMHYLAMKILTSKSVITIKGCQQTALQCFSIVSKVSYQIAINKQVADFHTKQHLTTMGLAFQIFG